MAFIENAIKSTRGFADISKMNYAISSEQKRIEGVYKEIGRKYFEKYSKDENNEFSAEIKEISESLNKITGLKEEILKIKGIKICVSCGAEMLNTAKFCSSCGAKARAEENNEKKCPKCNKAISEEAAFCTGCGHNIKGNGDVESSPQKCSNCNMELPDGAVFCTGCGQKL